MEKEERELLAKAQDIEFAIYDLKAVNPNIKVVEDTRTPTELLEVIAGKGREADEALAELRSLLGGKIHPEPVAHDLKVAGPPA